MIGPQLAFSDDLHAKKYRGEGESFREGVNRVASALQDNDDHYHYLRDILLHQRFLPAGRVQSAVGSTRQVTPYNCYVSGTIEDSLVEGNGSIMQRLHEAAATMRMGGGIGYDFSELRPHGDAIKTQHTQASGPVSFLPPFDAVCKTIASSGHRRGAQMAVLRIDHPDIEKFIHAKQNTNSLTAFNISIAVTDEFMQAVVDGTSFALRYGGTVYREVDARTLWEMIMRSTWDWAEPGVLFIDQINNMNNLWYCEVIAATNPCVPAGTPILTRRGWRAIEMLVDESVEIWNGHEWTEVTPSVTGHDQPLVTVHLSNGEQLTCTAAHKFVLAGGERVDAEDLQEGEELMTANWPVVEGGEDYPEAYTMGFFAGDGWTTHKEREKQLHVISFKRQDKKDCIPYLMSRKVSNLSSGYSFVYLEEGHPWNKEFVPGADWSIRSRLDWLAGLLDSDGTALWSYNAQEERSSCSLAISSINKTFIDKVSLMLRTLGVSTNRDVDNRSDREWANSKCCYRVAVKSSMTKQLQELGLHTNRIDLSQNNPRSMNNVRLKVVSVIMAGRADVVYCFAEPKRHLGCFNGVLTGQCGEQPLPPYGACLLGSFNLVKYLKREGKRYIFDWDQFGADIPHVVRAMDNVVDLANYPLYEQKKEARSKRRMGLGVTGLANCIEAFGPNFTYGSPDFLEFQCEIQKRLLYGCYRASIELAKEKGAFPLFDRQQYLSGQFIKTLPEDIRAGIAEHGIRNSHLTSIAPTGTISMTADNVSSGIEPVFAYSFERAIQEFEGVRVERIEDYGVRVLGVRGKRSRDVTVQEHLSVLSTAFQYVDSSVSKTCNVPGDTSWDDFKNIYIQAWKEGCKGCTTFRMDGRREGILAIKDEDSQVSDSDVLAKATNGAACYVDSVTGRKECE